jgi:hypothetical protein
MSTATNAPSIPTAVFSDPDAASRAIDQLRAAGFSDQEIRVVTANEAHRQRFRRFAQQLPAGSRTGKALTQAALVAVVLGALLVGAALAMQSDIALILAGAFAGLVAAGTFVAVMMTRGAEGELSDYYDQAVEHDRLIVAVEPREHTSSERVAAAVGILERTGEEAIELPREP